MPNPFYIPQGPSVSERVLPLFNQSNEIEIQRDRNRLMNEDIMLRGKALPFKERELDIEESKIPASRQNFDANKVKALGMALDRIDPKGVLKDIKKEFDFFANNPKTTTGDVYGNYSNNWDEYRQSIVASFREFASDQTQSAAFRNHYAALANTIEADKTGKTLDMFFPTVAREYQMQNAEMLSKLPQQQPYKPMTREEMLADLQAKAQIEAQNRPPREPEKTPTDMREFELYTYGKERPELRGSPQYKDEMMGYLKSKRDATVAPSKADPAVLRKEFIGQSKDFVQVRDSYNRIKASTNPPSPAGDLAMIFNYMKMLDPGSVVRESEFATAASTGAYGERIKAAVGKVMSGERLSDVMRKDFVDRSQMLYNKQLESHGKLKDEYDRISKGLGVESSNVIIDYLTEQTKIENKDYDVGSVYVGEDGTRRRYGGKDAQGNHIWKMVQ